MSTASEGFDSSRPVSVTATVDGVLASDEETLKKFMDTLQTITTLVAQGYAATMDGIEFLPPKEDLPATEVIDRDEV